MRFLALLLLSIIAVVRCVPTSQPVDTTTTPITLYDTVCNVDYATLQKGGFRSYWLPYNNPLRATSYSFDLSAYSKISRLILYTWHRSDLLGATKLSFKIDGVNAVLTSLGVSNGACWNNKKTYAYRWETTFGSGAEPLSLDISNIPSNALLDGFSLIVIYDDDNKENNRDLTILNGNDCNYPGLSSNWEWQTDVYIPKKADASDVRADFHIADVEWNPDINYMGSIFLNGVEVSSRNNPLHEDIFPIKEAYYWDVESFAVHDMVAGTTSHIESHTSAFDQSPAGAKLTQDCQNLSLS